MHTPPPFSPPQPISETNMGWDLLPELIIAHEYPLEHYFKALDLNPNKETIKIIIHLIYDSTRPCF